MKPRSFKQMMAGTVAAAALLLQPVMAQELTMETLLDRIQVEDLLTR